MFSFLRWRRPAAPLKCPFHRFIRYDGSTVLVRLSSIDGIREPLPSEYDVGGRCIIAVGGICWTLRNSMESVLEAVWDRDGDHV